MNVKIKNLGPVKSAEINFDNNLILFTGSNNTGKTYVANMLYSYYRLMDHEHKYIPCRPISDIFDEYITENFFPISKNKYKLANKSQWNIKQFIVETKQIFNEIIESNLKEMCNEIFSTQSKPLKPIIDINLNSTYFNNYLDDFFLETSVASSKIVVKNGILTVYTNDILQENISLEIVSVVKSIILSVFYKDFNRTFFFPAERTGISIFNKDIIINKNGFSPSKSKWKITGYGYRHMVAYPLSINDFSTFVLYIGDYEHLKSPFLKLAYELEHILGGKIQIEKNSGQYIFIEEKLKYSIKPNNTSSTIKSLAYFVLYLKHIAQKGDVIFIDEPELNLHPDNQRKIARILAKAVNKGIKVIVSTHSDYIVKEFNNLLMLSGNIKNKEKLLKKVGYTKDEILNKEEVGVYIFENSEVKQIPIDEYGIVSTTFDKTIDDINNASELISMEISKR